MEMHVLFRGALPTKAALTRAMKQLGFPFTIAGSGSLERQRGYMPVRFRGDETGVEFDVFDGREAIEEFSVPNIDPSFDRSANFRWGGDETEMVVAMCAAAALASLVNGIVLDDAEGKLLQPEHAIRLAKQHLAGLPASPKHGTRPSDIKRYLKSLLKQRDDLVLIGRQVFIRPVRHLLRGALLDRTSDTYRFTVWRYFTPLYRAEPGSFIGTELRGRWDVQRPHFEPYLLDSLAEDVFAPVGRMTTLVDFAAVWELQRAVPALLLAGERDRAEELVRNAEPQNPEHLREWFQQEIRGLLARDIGDFCAECHAREEKAVKELGIRHIWDPAPFPAELPPAERASKSSDPLFVPSPWPSRPSWLLQDLPERAGEVRFAQEWIERGELKSDDRREVLLVALSRDEAESRHGKNEPYVLAARLENGLLAILRRAVCRPVGWPRASPSPVSYKLEIYGSAYKAEARFRERMDGDRSCWLMFIEKTKKQTQSSPGWAHTNPQTGRLEITMREGTPLTLHKSNRALMDEERGVVKTASLAFGNFQWPVKSALTLLRNAGFGEVT